MKKGKQEFMYQDDAFVWASKNYNPINECVCERKFNAFEKVSAFALSVFMFGIVVLAILGF